MGLSSWNGFSQLDISTKAKHLQFSDRTYSVELRNDLTGRLNLFTHDGWGAGILSLVFLFAHR